MQDSKHHETADEMPEWRLISVGRMCQIAKAIRVESERHLGTSVPLAVDGLVTIVRDPKHPHQLKAIDSLLDRAGLARQRQLDVNVETYDKRSTAELIAALEDYKARRGMLIDGSVASPAAPSAPESQEEQG